MSLAWVASSHAPTEPSAPVSPLRSDLPLRAMMPSRNCCWSPGVSSAPPAQFLPAGRELHIPGGGSSATAFGVMGTGHCEVSLSHCHQPGGDTPGELSVQPVSRVGGNNQRARWCCIKQGGMREDAAGDGGSLAGMAEARGVPEQDARAEILLHAGKLMLCKLGSRAPVDTSENPASFFTLYCVKIKSTIHVISAVKWQKHESQ